MKWLPVLALVLLSGCATLKEGDAFQVEKRLLQAGFLGVESVQPQGLAPNAFQPSRDGRAYRYYLAEAGLLFSGGAHEYAIYQRMLTRDKARRADNLSRLGGRRPLGPLQW